VSALVEGPHVVALERTAVTGIDGAAVEVIHAAPSALAGAAPTAGVVVHPDVMGVRALFDDLCRRLATHGLAVACPEPFARASLEVLEAEDPTARLGRLATLDDAVQVGDLVAAADLLTERDGVATVHVLGFCMGGMQTLKAATSGRFARAVAFYGMIRIPDDWRGARFDEPLASAAAVCPTLAIFGGVDPWTSNDDIEALRAAWADRPDCEIVVYPEADHGFVHAPERPAHRADDAADAWRRTFAWLDVA
jgi:carboxymethylenebutenolidase